MKKDAQKFIEVISENQRFKILCVINQKPEITVDQIRRKVRIPQNLCSHHLGILRKIGAVKVKKQGTFRLYSIESYAVINAANDFIGKILY